MSDLKRVVIIAIVAIVGIFTVEQVMADDYDIMQHNFKLKGDDTAVEFRTNTGSDRDHIQFMKYIDLWELAYRYDDQKAKTEHRFKATYSLVNEDNFYIKPRVEYRYFEGSLDDYFRLRSTFGVRGHVTPKTTLYGEFTPMLRVGRGQRDDLDIDESQSKIGVNYRVNQTLTLGSFIQYETAGSNFAKDNVFLGTNFEVQF